MMEAKFGVMELIQFAGFAAGLAALYWGLKGRIDLLMLSLEGMKKEIDDFKTALREKAAKDYVDKEIAHLRIRLEKLEMVAERRKSSED